MPTQKSNHKKAINDLFSNTSDATIWETYLKDEKFVKFLKENGYSLEFDKFKMHEIVSKYSDYVSLQKIIEENPEYINEVCKGNLTWEYYSKNRNAVNESLRAWQNVRKQYAEFLQVAKENGIPTPKTNRVFENGKVNPEVADFMNIMDATIKKGDSKLKLAYDYYMSELEEYSLASKIGVKASLYDYCEKSQNDRIFLIGDAYFYSASERNLSQATAKVNQIRSEIESGLEEEPTKKGLFSKFHSAKTDSKEDMLRYAVSRKKTTISLEKLLDPKYKNLTGTDNIIGCYNAAKKALKSSELQEKCGIKSKSKNISFDEIFDYFWEYAENYYGNLFDVESYLLLPETVRLGVMKGMSYEATAKITHDAISLGDSFANNSRLFK